MPEAPPPVGPAPGAAPAAGLRGWALARLAEFAIAGRLLTRLPLGFLAHGRGAPAAAVWAWPLLGLVVGALGGAVQAVARVAGLPPLVAALWGLAAMLLATGALHEDALADLADGFGGGRTRERKLAIMRDSRIGSFGAAALIVSLLLRAGEAAALRPGFAIPALAAAGALSRTAMLGPVLLPPARADGLGASQGRPGQVGIAVAVGIAALAAFGLLPAGMAALGLIAAAAGGAAVAGLAWRQIGGQTGDVCGAAQQVAEALVLGVIAALAAR
ncbi:MAG TPA: adenosylcobinamide-GDP ribazoletransferase [Acetobacteraceae bacterium]|nr:adenosylcobinamide-GDP ribazoletransferase [Acetobacteraceae bacterium]